MVREERCIVAVVVAGVAASAQAQVPKVARRATTSPPTIQSDCTPSPNDIRQLAEKQLAQTPDEMDFLRAMDRAYGLSTPYVNTHPAEIIAMSDALGIIVTSPYRSYRDSVVEAFRKRELLADIRIPAGIVVEISPLHVDGPDIIKFVVERDGKEMRPLIVDLTPKPFTTRMGAKAVLHAGQIIYPCAAGGTVVATAIPEHGGNIVKRFTDMELSALK